MAFKTYPAYILSLHFQLFYDHGIFKISEKDKREEDVKPWNLCWIPPLGWMMHHRFADFSGRLVTTSPRRPKGCPIRALKSHQKKKLLLELIPVLTLGRTDFPSQTWKLQAHMMESVQVPWASLPHRCAASLTMQAWAYGKTLGCGLLSTKLCLLSWTTIMSHSKNKIHVHPSGSPSS